jgi:uncharacterized BrkB/YihY/UPF0761 family membrane protein
VLAFIDRIDRLQRRHRALAFPYAVVKRYGEDRGGWLGSLVAYYGFFSLFPLLVVFVTVATWVLGDHPELLQHILEAVWSRVPFVAAGLQSSVQHEVTSLSGNGWLTVLSVLVTVWGGIGVVRVLQDAVNTIWGVARFRRPGFVPKIARGLAILLLLGVGVVGSGIVAGLTVSTSFPVAGLVLVAIVNVVLAAAITIAVYRLSIAAPVELGELMPGAVLMGVGVYVLTLFAGLYVKHVVARMTSIYGPFAATIGLLAYVSLLVQLFVIATEVNVVRVQRLWPRSLTNRSLGDADSRAIELTMRRERLLAPKETA